MHSVPAVNIADLILQFAKHQPHAPALIEAERELTYAELARLVRGTAQHLSAQGLQPGNRVALCLKDTAGHIIAMLALALTGATAIPLDWRAKPAESARFIKQLNIICTLTEPDAPPIDGAKNHPLDAQWHSAVAQAKIQEDTPPADGANVFMISATSGSTGAPKFTQMTHHQYFAAITGMFEIMALSGPHRFLCTSPLYYSGGRNSCLAHLLRGDCVILYPSLFTAGEYASVIRDQNITVAVLVPTMVRQVLAAAQATPLFPDMAALFCSGAPLHAKEKRAAQRSLSPNFQERYGTSETLAIAVLRPEDFSTRIDSVGQPHSLIDIEVVDDEDIPLPTGQTGRLRLRGPGVASPLPEQPAPANFRNGWFYPGEIAYLDDAKFIFLQGRTSDVIIRNGAKIYPAEIEAVLANHPSVAEAAVLAQRTAGEDDIVMAFIVAKPPALTTDLLAYCRTRLTPHKIPRHFFIIETLPKNTAGKIDKLALAENFRREMTAP